MVVTEVIKNKRNGLPLSKEEIQFVIEGYTSDQIPDYQMAAWLMATLLKGMTDVETADLTQAMLDSGVKVDFGELTPVDKHSTGGVGDKTSLILAPIVAACGVPVPMMSGRGLGHTGGTLDKLESIPGFNVSLDLETFKKQVLSHRLCFIGQTKDICPADKKIYALRDVTATVESLSLICASIMSKKIAEGIKGLILDVKVGSGAFMKTTEDANALAKGLVNIGRAHGLETRALITNMDQPLGVFCGNAVEVQECVSIFKRESRLEHDYSKFADTEELSLELAAQMISIGKNVNIEDSRQQALDALNSGKAYEVFEKVCSAQGGNLNALPEPSKKMEILNQTDGYLSAFNTEKIGVAGIEMAAGRKKVEDLIDPQAGIAVHAKIGDKIEKGQPLFSLYGNEQTKGFDEAKALLTQCYSVSNEKVDAPRLITQ